MQKPALPPNVQPEDRVVLFDGVCNLCGAWARFLIRFDRQGIFKLCAVQSDEGMALLAFFGMRTDYFETMAVVEGPVLFTKSDAFFRVMRRLPFPWPLLVVFRVVPLSIRDWLYDRVARNRYKIFGRADACVLPTPDHERRFLQSRIRL